VRFVPFIPAHTVEIDSFPLTFPCNPLHLAADDNSNMITKTKKTTKSAKSQKKARKSSPDMRQHDRVKLIACATLYTELTPNPGEGHKVWLTNISLGGLAFKTRREYAVGDTYHIRLDAGPIDMSAPIQISWTRKRTDDAWDVGCEFLPD